MSYDVHHVPGRLRVKSRRLKRNPVLAQQVAALIEQLVGVEDCRVNLLTGSVIIHYHREHGCPDTLIQTLKQYGHVPPEYDLSTAAGRAQFNRALSQATDNLGKTLVNFALEKAVERSAAALLAALL